MGMDAFSTFLNTAERDAMRDRLFRFATASAVVAVVAWCPNLQAQQENRPAAGVQTQTENARQDANRTTGEAQTVRGVVAAITAEGEMMLDYRTNAAARSEAAFLTIVGSPTDAVAGEASGRTTTNEADRASTDPARRKRHNVYIAWLTPRTKICEGTDERAGDQKRDTDAANANANANAASSSAVEVALEKLEVGDHVEIKFSPSDNSATNTGAHQSQQMRQKHGRHRTFVGYATEVKILPAGASGHAASGSSGTAGDRSK
jgi:hypothetical protein